MGSQKGTLYILGMSLFRRLAGLYPARFRRQYAGEIFEVLLQRLEDAKGLGGAAMPAFIFRESGALIVSIIREHWHERQGRKEVRMEREGQVYRRIQTIFLKRRLERAARVVLLLAALIPLYYGCIYAYARIQIAEAKQLGVFPTLEDAVYSLSAGEVQGARVVRVDINHAEPCNPDGKLPFIWCVSLTVFYDQNPGGHDHSIFRGYSTYYHLREGWVFISELIPGFTGQVMELFRMEEVIDQKQFVAP